MVSGQGSGSLFASLMRRFFLFALVFSFVVIAILSSAASSKQRSEMMASHKMSLPDPEPEPSQSRWIATWTAAQHAGSLKEQLLGEFYQDDIALLNTTIRQTYIATIGADRIRIRLSNAFAAADLRVDKVTIALPEPEVNGETISIAGSGSIRLETLRTLSFSGRSFVIVPSHGFAISDPIKFPIATNEVVTISMYFRDGQMSDRITCHQASKTRSWFANGDQTASLNLKRADLAIRNSWYVVTAVEALKLPGYHAAVVLGDSITEGNSAYCKWPSLLFNRMQSSTDPDLRKISVVNGAIRGSRFLADNPGPNLSARLDSDVLAISGVKYAIILLGINDINIFRGTTQDQRQRLEDILAQYQQVITRLRAANIAVFGCTLSPQSCTNGKSPHFNFNQPTKEQQRLKFNEWVRNSGAFDAVVDLDEILRNPDNYTELAPALMGDDCLHPNDAGLREIATKFPIYVF